MTSDSKQKSTDQSPYRLKAQGEDIERLSRFLDESISLPFGLKVGWDSVIGLIPGAGDYITSFLSLYIVFRSAQMGANFNSIIRMLLNILLDVGIGQIPFLGDVFDIFWKSNKRNIEIFKSLKSDPVKANKSSRVYLFLVLSLIILSAAGILTLAYMSVQYLLGLF